MSSIVEVEASRVAEILGSAARQLELMALVPSRKRLAAMAAARAERGGASTSAHGRRGKAADPKHASPAGGAEAELLDAFSGLVSGGGRVPLPASLPPSVIRRPCAAEHSWEPGP